MGALGGTFYKEPALPQAAQVPFYVVVRALVRSRKASTYEQIASFQDASQSPAARNDMLLRDQYPSISYSAVKIFNVAVGEVGRGNVMEIGSVAPAAISFGKGGSLLTILNTVLSGWVNETSLAERVNGVVP